MGRGVLARFRRANLGSLTLLAVLAASAAGIPARALSPSSDTMGPITLVSKDTGQPEGTTYSYGQALSPDGRFVVFGSTVNNPYSQVGPENAQVYVRDTVLGTTELASVSSAGETMDALSYGVGISADGNRILFISNASNLVAGDSNGQWDLFLRDRLAGTTVRISLDEQGDQLSGTTVVGALSEDGGMAAFLTWFGTWPAISPLHIYIRDLNTGQSKLVAGVPHMMAPGSLEGFSLALSGDGRLVAFASDADVSPPEGADLRTYVYEIQTALTAMVPQPGGILGTVRVEPKAFSTDGRWLLVAAGSARFDPSEQPSTAPALYLYDRSEESYTPVPVPVRKGPWENPVVTGVMSADGRLVSFIAGVPADDILAGPEDVQSLLVFDREAGVVSRPLTDYRGYPLIAYPVPGAMSAGPPLPAAFSRDGGILLFSSGQNYIHPADGNESLDAFLFRFGAPTFKFQHRVVVPGLAAGEPPWVSY